MSCTIVASPVAHATTAVTSSPRWISPLRHASCPGRLLPARQRRGSAPAQLVWRNGDAPSVRGEVVNWHDDLVYAGRSGHHGAVWRSHLRPGRLLHAYVAAG